MTLMLTRLFQVSLVAIAALAAPAQAREIVDMAGRKIVLPDVITRVYSSSHPISVLLYALAPELLGASNFATREELRPYLPARVFDLPAIGAAMGHGPQTNPEEVLALHPDVVLVWLDRFSDTDQIRERYEKLGLTVLMVRLDTLADHPAALAFLGEALDRRDRAAELSAYIVEAMGRVKQAVGDIPAPQRRRVYYAESSNGLSTECDRSWHAEAIMLAGGDNIHHCEQTSHGGAEPISLEQVIAGRPDFILAQDRGFAQSALSDEAWRAVPAVSARAVATPPRLPFNWIDRPPSFMRAIGVQWLAHQLYPERFAFDQMSETRRFYRLFLGVDLSDQDIARIFQ